MGVKNSFAWIARDSPLTVLKKRVSRCCFLLFSSDCSLRSQHVGDRVLVDEASSMSLDVFLVLFLACQCHFAGRGFRLQHCIQGRVHKGDVGCFPAAWGGAGLPCDVDVSHPSQVMG